MKNSIVVVGLGYVGLPIAIAAAKSGFNVIGIDLNQEKVAKINSGKSPIEDVKDNEILDLVELGLFKAQSDYSQVKNADVVLICVPTPLTSESKPDLLHLESAAKSISKYLCKGTVIILESTVAPGTTRDFFIPLIQKYSGINLDELDFVFSPERIDPLNQKWNLKNTPKIVAGLTLKSRKRAIEFYSKFIDNKTLLFLKGYYQLQEGNNYLIAGGHVEYSINEIYQDFQQSFNLGLYYRVQNAIIPYIGFTYNQLQFGFSYDIQVSQIKNAAIRPNTFELTMIFKKQKKWWNPLI